ncbi:mitochondrial inner membrane protein [Papiliotrema laurentii]|uniref:Succinate dehydrogenase [ubiquinone] cytochrome b small subunit n=1 Tax=Papiliotrema laurentii TaxID=5418 RepID=A0AAD9L6K3_PAPLA|nr:mitochondrial inner membrane protein [Papiliotrema laurentii]
MSFARVGLRSQMGVRSLHTCTSTPRLPRGVSRALAMRASAVRRDATVSANETGGYKYIPGGPVLKGTVNDAAETYPPHKSHGSYHWTFERLLSASLIPVMGTAAVSTGSAHPILDGLLAVSLVVHSHIGFDSILIDYLHPRKFALLGPLAKWVLRAVTGLAVWGCYEFNTNDIGLTELVARLWKA